MRKVEIERNERKKQENIIIDNQIQLKELENFYVSGTIDNLPQIIEEKKEKLVNEMEEYVNKHNTPIKWDDEGNPIKFKIEYNPIVIQQCFFKSINTIHSIIPDYNAEKLALIYDYYCYLIAEVNDKIGNYPSSLNSFCKLAGLTISQLRNIKNNSYDEKLRIVAEKIYDEIGDTNITMAQMGIVSEKSTIFKLKTQNEVIEKVQPNINVNITKTINEEEANNILDRIGKYGNLINKKGK